MPSSSGSSGSASEARRRGAAQAGLLGDTARASSSMPSSSTPPPDIGGATPEELLAGLTRLQGEASGSSASAGDQDPAEVRATLDNVATGLAEQLSSITEEMNKIRQELYGDAGIGGIAKELEKLKAHSGGLGGLMDKDSLDGMLRPPGRERSASSAASGAADADLDLDAGRGSSDVGKEARRRRDPQREREFQELRKRLMEKRGVKPKARPQQPVSIWEKVVLLFLVLICLYIGSPFFRTSVKRGVASMLGVPFSEDDDEELEEFYFED